MGYYLKSNLSFNDLVKFCKENGQELVDISFNSFELVNVDNKFLICAVKNGDFIAVVVMYDKTEFKRWLSFDGREKKWFLMDKEIVFKELPYLKKENEKF